MTFQVAMVATVREVEELVGQRSCLFRYGRRKCKN